MCRWLAYSGSPVLLEDLLLKPERSLIDQSLHSRMGATTTNGDGFGVGWYGVGDTPGVFHSIEPAWNDRNLSTWPRHLVSPPVFAHIRASTGLLRDAEDDRRSGTARVSAAWDRVSRAERAVSARPSAAPPPGGSAWGPRVSEANAGAGPTGRGRAPDPTRCRRLRNHRTRPVG